jgi:hypothetical protein
VKFKRHIALFHTVHYDLQQINFKALEVDLFRLLAVSAGSEFLLGAGKIRCSLSERSRARCGS